MLRCKRLVEHYRYPLLNSTCLPIESIIQVFWRTAILSVWSIYLSWKEKVKSLRRNTMVTITTTVLALFLRFSNISCVWGKQWGPMWLGSNICMTLRVPLVLLVAGYQNDATIQQYLHVSFYAEILKEKAKRWRGTFSSS